MVQVSSDKHKQLLIKQFSARILHKDQAKLIFWTLAITINNTSSSHTTKWSICTIKSGNRDTYDGNQHNIKQIQTTSQEQGHTLPTNACTCTA